MERLTRKQKILIQNSRILTDYKILEKLFQNYDNITDEVLLYLTSEERQFVENSLYKIIEGAEKEWKTDMQIADDRGRDKAEWIPCSLCNTPNRYVFYIYNLVNGKSLNVGSDCIKQFGILEREGLNFASVMRNAKRYRLSYELEQLFPGVQKITDNWNGELDNFEVLIPSIFEEPYKELGVQMKEIISDYINGKISLGETEILRELLDKRHKLIESIKIWVDSQECEFVASLEIGRWMIHNNETTGLKWLKEDGKIILRTAHRITELGFMEKLAKKLRITYKDLGITLWEPDSDRKGYYVIIKPQSDVKLFCKHNELVKKHCGGYFGEEPQWATLDQILQLCILSGERRDYEKLFQRIVGQISGLSLYNSDLDSDFAIFREESKFVKISFKKFISKYFTIAYGKDYLIDDARKAIFNKNNIRYTWSELGELGYKIKK